MSKGRQRNKTQGKQDKKFKRINFPTKPSDAIKRLRERARKITASAGVVGNLDKILEQAKKLALEARETDPSITKIYWFPHDQEVRLIEADENTIKSLTGRVEPFYFDSTAEIPVPSGIAIIRLDEVGELEMPRGWGDWKNGQEL
ncbi:MAG: hypothetical protein V2B18_00490 [Pseudomonadota bacterium]